jgi:putative serine protease PepD
VRPPGGDRQGSGFVVDDAGHVVTNAHVVGSARTVRVSVPGRPAIPATVVVARPDSDLAVLALRGAEEGLPDGLRPLELGDASTLRVGEPAVAIGSPFGLQRTVTLGIVSGLHRALPTGESIVGGVIQTDASVNPGSSGGPLLDRAGRVIGVTTAISTGTGSDDGVAFAVPSGVVERVVDAALGRGPGLPWLGFVGQDVGPGTVAAGDTEGVRVAELRSGGPAASAGLEVGDVVVGVDGASAHGNAELGARVSSHDVGERVVLRVLRDGRPIDLDVTLGARPLD